ncbi:MAG: dihydrofolate reductase [Enterobacteriaceae bacterium]
MICAYSLNKIIGNKNKLPWVSKIDLKWFYLNTFGKIVVMGYNTYLSLNKKPLYGRKNIVITNFHKNNIDRSKFKVLFTTNQIVNLSKRKKEIIIIGGAKTYKSFGKYYNKIYITRIYKFFNGDTRFPINIKYENWDVIFNKYVYDNINNLFLNFKILKKK